MRKNDLRMFSAIVIVVILCFALAGGYLRHRATAIDLAAIDISDKAAPSIVHLSAAHREIKDLQLQIELLLRQAEQGVHRSTAELTAQCDRILTENALHEGTPGFPNEREMSQRVHTALARLDTVVDQFAALYDAGRMQEARQVAQEQVPQVVTGAINSIVDVIALNAGYVRDRAHRIRLLRRSLAGSAFLLNLLTVASMLACMGLLVYGTRRAAIRDAEQRMATERAAELELFGGRMAHDILNPVSVLSFLLNALEGEPTKEQLRHLVSRARANLRRIQQLLDGLLKFACAGARPEPGARVEVAQVLTDLEAELREQAVAASIELHVEPYAPCSVACSPGILSSLLTNLAHNAIKYIGTAGERRITIRVLPHGKMVRFEVEDTGIGLPPAVAKGIFEPHIREKRDTQPGFGLGLATVRKAAEAHGGAVGVRSAPGRGSLFWFELPRSEPT